MDPPKDHGDFDVASLADAFLEAKISDELDSGTALVERRNRSGTQYILSHRPRNSPMFSWSQHYASIVPNIRNISAAPHNEITRRDGNDGRLVLQG
jgi:hypothetical protein